MKLIVLFLLFYAVSMGSSVHGDKCGDALDKATKDVAVCMAKSCDAETCLEDNMDEMDEDCVGEVEPKLRARVKKATPVLMKKCKESNSGGHGPGIGNSHPSSDDNDMDDDNPMDRNSRWDALPSHGNPSRPGPGPNRWNMNQPPTGPMGSGAWSVPEGPNEVWGPPPSGIAASSQREGPLIPSQTGPWSPPSADNSNAWAGIQKPSGVQDGRVGLEFKPEWPSTGSQPWGPGTSPITANTGPASSAMTHPWDEPNSVPQNPMPAVVSPSIGEPLKPAVNPIPALVSPSIGEPFHPAIAGEPVFPIQPTVADPLTTSTVLQPVPGKRDERILVPDVTADGTSSSGASSKWRKRLRKKQNSASGEASMSSDPNEENPTSLGTLMTVVFVCIAVAILAIAAFVLNGSKNARY